MQLLIDENIRREVIEFLKSSNHNVLLVIPGWEDEKIAQIAKETKRIILTHDRHFADIIMYPPQQYCGIIRIKIHPPTAQVIINALEELFQKFSQQDLDRKLVILEKDGFRIR